MRRYSHKHRQHLVDCLREIYSMLCACSAMVKYLKGQDVQMSMGAIKSMVQPCGSVDFQLDAPHLIHTNSNNYLRLKHIFISVEMIKMQILFGKYHNI